MFSRAIDPTGCNVYLCAPVSDLPREDVVKAFKDAENLMYFHGAKDVFVPTRAVRSDCSHERAMLRCLGELTFSDWENDCTKPYYDLLVCLDGWAGSKGCLIERLVATSCGIEICMIDEIESKNE